MVGRMPIVRAVGLICACALGMSLPALAGATSLKNGELWLDDNGAHVNAHGGCVLFHGGRYWWYGEHKEPGVRGNRSHGIAVHAYSSEDLVNWRDEGGVLTCASDPCSDIADNCIIQRPKVLFCAKTGQFVMHFHLELAQYGRQYLAARTGVAVSDAPNGPFRYLYGARPNAGCWPQGLDTESCRIAYSNLVASASIKYALPGNDNPDSRAFDIYLRDFDGGQMTRDLTLFVDDDGKAYQISASEENSTLQIAELTDDYLWFTGRFWRMADKEWTEAPAVFKHGDWYYLLGSGCTGWAPNKARLYRTRKITGPWERLGNPCRGTNPETGQGVDLTWGCQSAFVLSIPGESRQIAIFDMWRPNDAIDGRYVWVPIDFSEDVPVIHWHDEWVGCLDAPSAKGPEVDVAALKEPIMRNYRHLARGDEWHCLR